MYWNEEGLFETYVDTWLKWKEEASDWSDDIRLQSNDSFMETRNRLIDEDDMMWSETFFYKLNIKPITS